MSVPAFIETSPDVFVRTSVVLRDEQLRHAALDLAKLRRAPSRYRALTKLFATIDGVELTAQRFKDAPPERGPRKWYHLR